MAKHRPWNKIAAMGKAMVVFPCPSSSAFIIVGFLLWLLVRLLLWEQEQEEGIYLCGKGKGERERRRRKGRGRG